MLQFTAITDRIIYSKNTSPLVAAAKEIGLEVNADNTKYMVVSRDQRAGRNHSVKIDSNSFEGVEEFKYLGTTLKELLSIFTL